VKAFGEVKSIELENKITILKVYYCFSFDIIFIFFNE
jgi:hypothetical protein